MHITDWYPALVALAGALPRLMGWMAATCGQPSVTGLAILHNIDPLYNHARHAPGGRLRHLEYRRAGRHPRGRGSGSCWRETPAIAWIPPQPPSLAVGGTWRGWPVPARPCGCSNIGPSRTGGPRWPAADVVRALLTRLVDYNRTAIPVRYPAENPRPILTVGVHGALGQ